MKTIHYKEKSKIIESITPFTLIDFKQNPSAILWFSGCNMKCQFCYNPEIVFSKGKFCFDETLEFFKSRQHLLKGVVLCGGEPTVHDEIIDITRYLKNLNYKIKLDTNGIKPNIVKILLDEKLIDFVALDFKSTFDKFKQITSISNNFYEKFIETLKCLISSNIDFEVRTTIHNKLLKYSDIKEILDTLEKYNYKKKYYLQNFVSRKETIGNLDENTKRLSKKDFKNISKKYSFDICIRN